MATPASIAGHPIHPMLVPLPIGLLVFSFLADLFFLWGAGNPAWVTVALYTMAGGIVGALLAAVFGVIDLVSLPPSKAKRIGIWHMTINLAVVAVFAVSLWLRVSGSATDRLPVMLSFVGVALLVVSGWLGGHMVYVHGVGQAPEHRKE
ncbi:MAG TPA: DUF2231 domain-containing protein [Casimicrobiaceae bacterium]|nr:DUF2231 domain-containing protein [Casimicrobiaceae bacterium]